MDVELSVSCKFDIVETVPRGGSGADCGVNGRLGLVAVFVSEDFFKGDILERLFGDEDCSLMAIVFCGEGGGLLAVLKSLGGFDGS